MVFPIVGQGFVEFSVFFFGDVVDVSSPERFSFVQLFLFHVFSLDSLGFLVFGLGVVVVLVDLLDFWLVFVVLVFFSLPLPLRLRRPRLPRLFPSRSGDGLGNR